MTNRDTRARLARETVEILEQGFYLSHSDDLVEISLALESAVTNSILYKPEMFTAVSEQRDKLFETQPAKQTTFEVVNATTLEVAKELYERYENLSIACLNFASAKNPGGGFLGGSQAQEESLARSSGLYSCLMQRYEMYEFNRQYGSSLYSEHMIYSPDVPVFRTEDGSLLSEPCFLSFITAPAVNAGAVRQNEASNISQINQVMNTRMEKVLSVAFIHNHDTFILGAWGCGVFKNEPKTVAHLFANHLQKGGKFFNRFNRIVFAVFDRTEKQEIFAAFEQAFA
jgi:uncharacterized protein (TIGR02452 family)